MLDYDYAEKTKKKKKHSKEEKVDKILGIHKAKPVRKWVVVRLVLYTFVIFFLNELNFVTSFKIIDDDIGLNSLRPSDEAEAMVDLLGPDAPLIVDGLRIFALF